mmetsp:Transcript_22603/g.73143  ORF Transcript_22603/g.73143 Transcript_22603/m.73143 type:complete len:248 (+) Transcript_22603:110-853(+)
MVAASTLVRLAVVVASAATMSASDVAGACRMGDRCVSGQPSSQEHLLLQARSNRSSVEVHRHDHAALSSDRCQSQSVSRRRRYEEMTSCRRRHSSAGQEDTDGQGEIWTCDEHANVMTCDASRAPADDSNAVVGFPSSGGMQACGLWCAVSQPPDDWNLKYCPFNLFASAKTRVKVLTYNLFWWNLFDQKKAREGVPASSSHARLVQRATISWDSRSATTAPVCSQMPRPRVCRVTGRRWMGATPSR